MNWTSIDTWIVITGALCAAACALPGCFLVLRKMSMMGDAISHAVLPGLAIAFIVTGERASVPMFLGAAATGVLTAVFTQWIHRFARVDQGAAMGVVFTTLFALGLVLIVHAADHVDLDASCVLYGAIEFTPLDTVALAGMDVPRAALINGVMLLVNIAVIALLFKELRLAAFDPGLAATLGFSPGFLHYLLMTLVAVTTVAAFESVGSIIVIAMLIVPAATAQLITRRLLPMLLASVVAAVLAAVLGHAGALWLPSLFGFDATTTSGMMAFASGVLFIVVAGLRALVWFSGHHHGKQMMRVGECQFVAADHRIAIPADPDDLVKVRQANRSGVGTSNIPSTGVATTRPVPTCHPPDNSSRQGPRTCHAKEKTLPGTANHAQKPATKYFTKTLDLI